MTKRRYVPRPPESALPTDASALLAAKNAEIASGETRARIRAWLSSVPELLSHRASTWDDARGYPEWKRGAVYAEEADASYGWRRRGEVRVQVGIGKTQGAILEIAELLSADESLRVAYVVPEHKLAAGVLDRFRKEFLGTSRRVEVWRGIAQPDPDAPGKSMCQRASEAEQVIAVGGAIGDLCGSKTRGYCQHHPAAGGTCGYVRQTRERQVHVWIVPAAMLEHAAPKAMGRRVSGVAFPPFDLVVLDEAPWLSLVATEQDAQDVLVALLHKPRLLPRSYGVQAQRWLDFVLRQLDTSLQEWFRTDDLMGAVGTRVLTGSWSFSRLLYATVPEVAFGPADNPTELAEKAKARAAWKEVTAIVRLYRLLLDYRDGKRVSAASFTPILASGAKVGVRLSWRREIHPDWLDCPILYLDATGRSPLARQWLGIGLRRVVTTHATTPHQRVVQVRDKVMGYYGLKNDARRLEQIARMLPVIGRARGVGSDGARGLIACPKFVAEALLAAGLPPGWSVVTFGSLRGVDDYADVRALVVVGRPCPALDAVERLGSVVFGRDVVPIPAPPSSTGKGSGPVFRWFEHHESLRICRDGQGLYGEVLEAERHPDAAAELVRWTASNAEVIQAVGRARGVWRGPENPVLVVVLTNTPLDMPVDETVLWSEMQARCCGPLEHMLALGIVPEAWRDVAAVCSDWFGVAKDPEDAAQQWFTKEHPEEGALLAKVRGYRVAALPWGSVFRLARREIARSTSRNGKVFRRYGLTAPWWDGKLA